MGDKVRRLRPLKQRFDRPLGWTLFPTEYKKPEQAETHARRLKAQGYQVAIVKSPFGWNVCEKSTKKSLERLKIPLW